MRHSDNQTFTSSELTYHLHALYGAPTLNQRMPGKSWYLKKKPQKVFFDKRHTPFYIGN